MVPNKFIRIGNALLFEPSHNLFELLPVLSGFPAIKPEVKVGDIWFLICSLESRLLAFV